MICATRGYETIFVPIDYHKRAGKSSIKAVDFFNFLKLICKLSLFFKPLKVFAPLSLLFLMLAIIAPTLYVAGVVNRFYDTTFVVLVAVAIQTFFFGLLAEIIVHNKFMYWDKLKKEIIDTDLYSRSGTEVGVSGGVLDLKEKNGDYYPIKLLDRDIPEISCKASSDKYINYPKLNKFVFGKLPESWLVGEYKKIFIGHIKNKNVRRNASSGGIVP